MEVAGDRIDGQNREVASVNGLPVSSVGYKSSNGLRTPLPG